MQGLHLIQAGVIRGVENISSHSWVLPTTSAASAPQFLLVGNQPWRIYCGRNWNRPRLFATTFLFPAHSTGGCAGLRPGLGKLLVGMWLEGHRMPQFVLHLSSCGVRDGLGFAWSRKGLCLLTDFPVESQIPSVLEDIIFHQHVGCTCQVKHQRGKLSFPPPALFPTPQLNQILSFSGHGTFSHPSGQLCQGNKEPNLPSPLHKELLLPKNPTQCAGMLLQLGTVR